MKNSIKILILILITFSCETKKPDFNNDNLNVLFIMADDLNCDLGSYGHPQVISPNIDKLANSGVLFENAHNQFPLCGPSRVSLMTGMYSDQTMHTQLDIDLRQTIPDVVTLGQRYRQRGYKSVRIGKIYHYGNPGTIGSSGQDDITTWDYTINPYGRDKDEEYKINTLRPRQYGGTLSWLSAEGKDEEQTDGIGATEAIEQLEKFSKNGQNFFLAVGMFRPHTPFVSPKKYFDMYEIDEMEIPYDGSSDEYLSTIPIPAAISVRWKKDQILLNDGYYDDAVEKLGDHKPAGELRGGKYSLFEAGTRVPFITYWKGKTKPQVSDEIVSQIDFLNSFSSLLGSDIKSRDGVDLSDVFFNNKGNGRNNLVIEAIKRTALRSGNWAMIPPYNGPAKNTNVNIELGNSKEYKLYDLENDISQRNNIAKSNPEKLQEMINLYSEIIGNESIEIKELILE